MPDTSAKSAFATRHVPPDAITGLLDDRGLVPRPGDVVVARVTSIGQHKRLELRDGRRAVLFEGDEVIVAYGNRYAPDQFEAVVPRSLDHCQLVAAGGIAAEMLCRHGSVSDPTGLTPVGLAAGADGTRLNLADCAPARVLAVAGTSMNAGKTTMLAHLARGLTSAGARVGAAKVTGTGAGGDLWAYRDAGAVAALDFTDAGAATTSLMAPRRIERILADLLARLGAAEVDVALVEVADGLLQPETTTLLEGGAFRRAVDGVLFAAADAIGAAAGVAWLRERDLPVLAVGGRLTTAPLCMREATRVVDVPVLGSADLLDTATALGLAGERIHADGERIHAEVAA